MKNNRANRAEKMSSLKEKKSEEIVYNVVDFLS